MTSPCSLKSCSLSFNCIDSKPKRVTLVSVIALAAIAMLVVGCLGLTTPHILQIGFTVSVVTIALGGIIGSIAFFIAIRMARTFTGEIAFVDNDKEKPALSLNTKAQEIVIPEISEEDPISPPRGLYREKIADYIVENMRADWKHLSTTKESDFHAQNELTQRQEKVRQHTIDQLHRIYGNEEDFPQIYIINQDLANTLQEQFELALLADEDVLQLKLSDITTFPYYKMQILLHRLSLIEKKQMVPGQAAHSVETLGDLRNLGDKEALLKWVTNPRIAPLFCAWQIALLFDMPGFISNEKLLNALLPITFSVRSYTKEKLQEIEKNKKIQPLLAKLPDPHIYLLSDDYFRSPLWVWDKERVAQFTPKKNFLFYELQRVVQTISPKTIATLKDEWRLPHLKLFSMAQLTDPAFPWSHYISIEGFGSWLKGRSSSQFKEIYQAIPWHDFVRGHQDECAKVFQLGLYVEVKAKIACLPMKIICELAPIWKPCHLELFPEGDLTHQHFPWDSLARQKGFGRELRNLCLPGGGATEPAKIDLTRIPLEVLERDEVLELSQNHPTRESLLSRVNISIIQKIAHHLEPFHLEQMSQKWQDPQFPWNEFLKKQSFSSVLSGRLEMIPFVPMVEFAKQNPKGFQGLFDWNLEDFSSQYCAAQRLVKIPVEVRNQLFAGGFLQARHQTALRLAPRA